MDVSLLEQARSERAKAVILAHTLGCPFDLGAVKAFCDRHGLWLIEDNCDALGSEYQMNGAWRKTGTIGDIGTSSFYPAHHITTGEGGAVYTGNPLLHRIIRSLRDWGRDCVCGSGEDNTCGRRFDGQFGTLPEKTPDTEPSWFGFLITVREASPVSRDELVACLEANNIQTRPLFAGNLTRHPCFQALEEGKDYRIAGTLAVTDRIMRDSFWLGVYPGMERAMLDQIVACIEDRLGR